MWTRAELKSYGKTAFKANYWRCVLVALIFMLIGGTGAGVVGSSGISHSLNNYHQEQSIDSNQDLDSLDLSDEHAFDDLLNGIGQADSANASLLFLVPFVLLIILIAVGASIAVTVLVINPLIIGCERFFSENSRRPAGLGEIAFGFEHGYGRVVKTMFLKDLFLVLWTCLFIIPGIIKSYSYRMVPYILAQEPELSGREAIDRSREMMDGHKWRAFVLDLSFILWHLLAAFTMGIVGVFYVVPYVEATNAELYYALRGEVPGSEGDAVSFDYSDTNAPL